MQQCLEPFLRHLFPPRRIRHRHWRAAGRALSRVSFVVGRLLFGVAVLLWCKAPWIAVVLKHPGQD